MKLIKKSLRTGLKWTWISLLVIALDRITKLWALHSLVFSEPKSLLPFCNLTLCYNTGAAFAFLNSASGWQNVFLGTLAVIVSLFIIYWLAKSSSREYLLDISLALVLGGAIGNALDRVIYGYVIDFIALHWDDWHFAVFNVADSAICVGAVMLFWYWVRQSKD